MDGDTFWTIVMVTMNIVMLEVIIGLFWYGVTHGIGGRRLRRRQEQ